MRRLALCTALLLVVAVALNRASHAPPVRSAQAQAPTSAATVLANVQQFYANANQLTAFFRQTVTNATFGSMKTNDGRLWVLEPSYFRFDYMSKQNGKVVATRSFVFDGTTLWLIDHSNKQIVQTQVQSSALPAAVSFLLGTTMLSSQFTVTLDTSGTYGGKADHVLALRPMQPSAQYQRLFFVVDPSNWRVKATIVIDANGNTNRFNFYTPNLTASATNAMQASWFQVTPASLPTYKLVQLNPTTAAAGWGSGSSSGSGSGSGSGSSSGSGSGAGSGARAGSGSGSGSGASQPVIP